MADAIPRFECGDTRLFSLVFSSAPGTAPLFSVFVGSGATSCVQSVTATSETALSWTATFTIAANSPNLVYEYQWVASYTAGPVVERGLFLASHNRPW